MTVFKYIFLFLVIAVLFSSCKTKSKLLEATKKNSDFSRVKYKLLNNIVDAATVNIGVKHKIGGTTKTGFDCSGLVYIAFGKNGISLSRTSIQQSKIGLNLGKNISKAQKGDLIFFKTNNSSQINHVGIITEVLDDEVKFVHASTSKGVTISSTKDPYYQKAFAQINRILE